MFTKVDELSNSGHMNKPEPMKGLEFETKEEAYTFYREYASSIGFGITIKASRRSKKSGRFIDVKIACSRFGISKRSNSDDVLNSKTDCKARMHIKRRPDDGKWFIHSFVEEHNHEVIPQLNSIKQSSTESIKETRFHLGRDDDGEFQSLLDNLMLIQVENPGFLYVVDLHKGNVFWIDPKARQDYFNFGDVICFDTSGKGSLIFGVNHHCQFILFGCAILGDDMAYSNLVWLFHTWIRAVGGQSPEVIITKIDGINNKNNISRNEAIAEVFPRARHCFSLSNVLKSIRENIPPHVLNATNFNTKFEKCLYQSWTEEDFEKRWWKLMDRFELREINYVQCLYENRRKWVPIYMKNICLSGLCMTTEDSCLKSFLDKLIKNSAGSTYMKKFMDDYRLFLRQIYEEESKADEYKEEPTLRSSSPYEKQMSTAYTSAIFEKFQVEVLGMTSCNILPKKICGENADCETLRFQVNDLEKQANFVVELDQKSSGISCLCRLFEYRGFLCRHAMVVLEMRGYTRIPSQYIRKRWTKTAKEINNTMQMSMSSSNRIERFNHICKLAIRLGEEGSLSQENYKSAMCRIEQALKHCVNVNKNAKLEEESRKSYHVEKKKKKPQKKQKVHKMESVSVQVQEGSQQMEMLNRNAAEAFDTCPYIPQQVNLQQMELGSRTTANINGYYLFPQQSIQPPIQAKLSLLPSSGCGGYYVNQQVTQPLGQWNSTPMRIQHYGPQQTLQELLQAQLNFRAPIMDGCFNIQDDLQEEDEVETTEQSANATSKHLHDKHLPP